MAPETPLRLCHFLPEHFPAVALSPTSSALGSPAAQPVSLLHPLCSCPFRLPPASALNILNQTSRSWVGPHAIARGSRGMCVTDDLVVHAEGVSDTLLVWCLVLDPI